jgi:hypothetical protein
MTKQLLSLLFVAVLTSTGFAQSQADVEAEANALYAARDYQGVGNQNVKKAIDLYRSLFNSATTKVDKVKYAALLSKTVSFLGESQKVDAQAAQIHDEGIKAAAEGLKAYGLDTKDSLTDANIDAIKALPKAEKDQVAAALFYKGLNLGQWGNANGITSSLTRWPELRKTLESVIRIGNKEIHHYGPYRILGRAYHKIPGFLGGDMAKAEKYLQTAFDGTLNKETGLSTYGHNTYFLIETLAANGKKDKSKELLKSFLETAAEKVTTDMVPEYKKAQAEAEKK